jgi:membrane protease YdiL (CAAX protease family)
MFPGSFIWNRISDEWLTSKAATGLFAASSGIILIVTPIWFGYLEVPNSNLLENLFLGFSGVAGALSIFFLWGGMWRYWIRLDLSRRSAKRLSFCTLLFGIWYGAILYYLFVYFPAQRGAETESRAKEAN